MYTEQTPDLFLPSLYLPWSKKKANNFEWLEEMCDYYEYYESSSEESKRKKRIKLNYDLYNGRFDLSEYMRICTPMELQWAGYSPEFDSSKIKHYSVIDTVAKSIVGEQRRRNMNITIYNVNQDSINQRKARKLELLQAYLNQQILDPIRQQITQQYFMENGIEDPYKLNADQQRQASNEIEQRVTAATPKEILSYMRKDYRTFEDKQLQRLYDYIRHKEQLKFKTDQGFEHGVIAGTECYYVPILNNDVKVKVVNPSGLDYYLADDKFFIEDAEWVKYESYLPYTDIFNDYKLSKKEMEKLNSLSNYDQGSNGYEHMRHVFESRLVSVVKEYPELNELDINTKDGQNRLRQLHEKYGLPSSGFYSIRSLHVVFKALRKLYVVRRPNVRTQRVETFYFDEAYVRQPGDLSVEERMVPEAYGVRKLGEAEDAIYIDKGPIPYQYRSLHNPFDIKLPYYGAAYSRLQNNSENVSLLDLGTPWQYRLDLELTRLDEALGTDIGSVLLMNMAAIPNGWDVDRFQQTMRYKKIAPLDFTQEGIGPFDAQLFKQVDLSNSKQINEKLGLISWIANQIPLSMSYNPSRLGVPLPSMPVTTNQQNIMQSTLQTESVFAMHNMIVANLVTGILNAARVAFKDNPIQASYILDDMSLAELELDSERLWRSEIGLFISNDSEDYDNLRMTKELLHSMIQGGLISGLDAIKVIWSKSGTDLINLIEESTEKMQAAQQQQMQAQIEGQERIIQVQAELKAALEKQQQDFELVKQANELAMKEFLAGVQAAAQTQQFANQYDINKNNENDANERLKEELKFEREKLDKELKQEEKLTKDKLEVEKMKARKSSKST